MSTMTCDAPTVKIARTLYRVEAIGISPEIGRRAFHLSNLSNRKTYAVHTDCDGRHHCDCPDATFRREGTGRPCKHVVALVAAGRLDPEPEPTAAAPVEATTCPACNGDGRVPNKGRCLRCEGSGTIPADEAPAVEAPAEDADPADWPAWTDAETWGLGPDREPVEAETMPVVAVLPGLPAIDDGTRLTLLEALERIAGRFAAADSDLGDLIAHAIGELAQEARITGASSVAMLLDRRTALGCGA